MIGFYTAHCQYSASVIDGGGSIGSSWGDYDNDGHLDLFVTNRSGQVKFLYRNKGDGTFVRITNGDIVDRGGRSRGSSWGDYNNDGNLDLFVANIESQNNFLYRNNGDGTFSKITAGKIVKDGGNSRGSNWGDYDNDGDLDLFVTNQSGQSNFLYRNNGNGTFTRITDGQIVNDGGDSIGSSWGDYDNDGDLDLFVTNRNGENNFLYRNNGNSTFSKITDGVIVNDGGHSLGSGWADFDNDGNLDLFIAEFNDVDQNLLGNNFLYRNKGDGTFAKITTGSIVNDAGRSFGSSWGDYNGDGYVDLFVTNFGEKV